MSKFFISFINAIIKPKAMQVDYQHLYDTAVINGQKIPELKKIIAKIKDGQDQYEHISHLLGNNIPWWFIAVIHHRESGNNFSKHLHCGDPLTARTVHVPKGRPIFNPGHGKVEPSVSNPYSFEESAIDSLTFSGYNKPTNWSIPTCLYMLEKFNGMGYNNKGLLSPYLWCYTNYYTKGYWVKDGPNGYDPNAMCKSAGVAAILKMLLA
jgi:lysozyme family protein